MEEESQRPVRQRERERERRAAHLEVGGRDDRDLGVELLVGGRVLVVVALAVKADAEAVGHVLDALAPDGLVDRRLEEDLLGAHGLLRKDADGLDRRGGALDDEGTK